MKHGLSVLTIIEHLEKIWRLPDEGLWEVRGGARQFTHSKVMAWVAFDRAIRTIERHGLEGPLERWRTVRDQIHRQVCEEGFDKNAGAFTRSYGSSALDASALLIPLVGFLPASDPRVHSTVEAIGKRLRVDGLIRRCDTEKPRMASKAARARSWPALLVCRQSSHDRTAGRSPRTLRAPSDALQRRGLCPRNTIPWRGACWAISRKPFRTVARIDTANNLSHSAKPATQRSCQGACPDCCPWFDRLTIRVNPLIELDLILSLSKDEGSGFTGFSAAWLVRLIRPTSNAFGGDVPGVGIDPFRTTSKWLRTASLQRTTAASAWRRLPRAARRVPFSAPLHLQCLDHAADVAAADAKPCSRAAPGSSAGSGSVSGLFLREAFLRPFARWSAPRYPPPPGRPEREGNPHSGQKDA